MKMPAGIEKWGSGVLGVVSLLLAANLVNQFRHTRPGIVQAAPGHKTAPKAGAEGKVPSHAADDLSAYDPAVHLEALKELDARPLPDTSRSLFSFVEPPPPPAPPPSPGQVQAPPAPPPVQMKIMGYNEMPGGVKQAFASYQDQMVVVQEGDVVGSRYKVLKITPMAVVVEDATSHETTELPVPQ